MPNRSLGKFLLRGSLLLTAMLSLWWLALQLPLLTLLRLSEEVTLRLLGSDSGDPIAVEPSGDWTFRVPVEDSAKNTTPAYPSKIHSITFSMPRSDVVLFTFSLPVYWAIVLAALVRRSDLQALVWGTVLVAVVEVLSLLGFLEITAHSVLAQMHPAANWLGSWPRELGNYLLMQVIPFVAPILIAVASHRELRSHVFPQAAQSARRDSRSRPAVR
jgi:hypothetical protein